MRLSRSPHPRCRAGRSLAGFASLLAALVLVPAGGLVAQIKSPAERIDDLEQSNKDLRGRLQKLEKEMQEQKATAKKKPKKEKEAEGKKEPFYSDGLFTLGGVKLQLGGKAEILMVVPESEDDPVVGSSEYSDPYFELNRLRLEPSLLFGDRISLESQIDFKPTDGDTILRELTARFNLKRPVWWFDTEVRVGLDDRFIWTSRRTKYYPLIGNAIWRRESLALTWGVTLGDKDGRPDDGGSDGYESTGADGVIVVKRQSAFDFIRNPGEVNLFFSIGNGYTLDFNQINRGNASFNWIVQDGRNLTTDLAMRELGFGAKYVRDFEGLGELSLLGFYYNDKLNDSSKTFLQNDLTLFVGGVPVYGYGLSDADGSSRYGGGIEYFLPARSIFGKESGARKKDGLRLVAQWIQAQDGDLRRQGWYVQSSYRFSVGSTGKTSDGEKTRGLIASRYFRTLEPVIRYGKLDLNIDPIPQLPGLWDRSSLLLGLITEVTSNVFVKAEYAFNWEDTGASPAYPGPKGVANNEFLLELLLEF